MNIRRATVDDATSVRHVVIAAVEQTNQEDFEGQGWENFLIPNSAAATRARLVDNKFLLLVAEQDDEIVGVITILNFEVIYQLFVLEKARRAGIATALWTAARQICQQQGNTGFYHVKSSTLAVPLYQSFGFKVTGVKASRNGVSWYPMDLLERD